MLGPLYAETCSFSSCNKQKSNIATVSQMLWEKTYLLWTVQVKSELPSILILFKRAMNVKKKQIQRSDVFK